MEKPLVSIVPLSDTWICPPARSDTRSDVAMCPVSRSVPPPNTRKSLKPCARSAVSFATRSDGKSGSGTMMFGPMN
jgi:hypothetical protein